MRDLGDEDWPAWLIPEMPTAKLPKPLQPHPTLNPRRGGVVAVDGCEHVTCPHCGNVAVWPPNPPVALHCRTPGHRVVRTIGGVVVGEVCPEAER